MDNYTIQFNTAENSFTIDFGNENQLHVDLTGHIARKLHKGEVKDYFDITGVHVDVFYRIVKNIAKSL